MSLYADPSLLESLVVGDTEAPRRHRSSLEMPNLPSYVYIGDLRPTELIILKQFNSMLHIQSPPYSCDSITVPYSVLSKLTFSSLVFPPNTFFTLEEAS